MICVFMGTFLQRKHPWTSSTHSAHAMSPNPCTWSLWIPSIPVAQSDPFPTVFAISSSRKLLPSHLCPHRDGSSDAGTDGTVGVSVVSSFHQTRFHFRSCLVMQG